MNPPLSSFFIFTRPMLLGGLGLVGWWALGACSEKRNVVNRAQNGICQGSTPSEGAAAVPSDRCRGEEVVASVDGLSTAANDQASDSTKPELPVAQSPQNTSSLGDIPDFSEVNLGQRFNRNKTPGDTADPLDKDKMFRVQRIPFYRSIWLDVRQNNWAKFDQVANTFNEADKTRFLQSVWKEPPTAKHPHMSIYQVLTKAAQADVEKEERYVVLGHTLSTGLDNPAFPTAVLSVVGSDQGAIAPPEDYDLVFSMVGPSAAVAMAAACGKVAEDNKAGIFPDPINDDICKFYSIENATANHTIYGQGITKTESYSEKKSVAVWRPVPAKGYQCLGDLATNGELNQPYLNIDATGSIGKTVRQYSKTLSASLDYAVYCIKETYLSPGKLGKPIAYYPSEQLWFFHVEPADVSGYADSHLFITLNAKKKPIEEQLAHLKFWVLNKTFLHVLGDIKGGSSRYKKAAPPEGDTP